MILYLDFRSPMPSKRRLAALAAEGIPLGCPSKLKDYYRTTKRVEDALKVLMKRREEESEEGQARKKAEMLRLARLRKANPNVSESRLSGEEPTTDDDMEISFHSFGTSTGTPGSSILTGTTSVTTSTTNAEKKKKQHHSADSVGGGSLDSYSSSEEEEEDDELETPMLCSTSTAAPEPEETLLSVGVDLSPEEREQLIMAKLNGMKRTGSGRRYLHHRRRRGNRSRETSARRGGSGDTANREKSEGVNMERAFHHLLRRVNRRLATDPEIPRCRGSSPIPAPGLNNSSTVVVGTPGNLSVLSTSSTTM